MVEEPVSPGREHARVPRNDLSQPIHSSARSAEKRADSAPSVQAAYTPLAAFACEWTPQWSNRGCYLHPGKARGNRGPRHPRSLGGRSAGRRPEQSHRHPGGAPFAFYHAGQSAQQRHGGCGGRAEPACSETPRVLAALVDLGPRIGDGQTQELHGGHECESVLLRSAEPLAARHERKHERAAATVLQIKHKASIASGRSHRKYRCTRSFRNVADL